MRRAGRSEIAKERSTLARQRPARALRSSVGETRVVDTLPTSSQLAVATKVADLDVGAVAADVRGTGLDPDLTAAAKGILISAWRPRVPCRFAVAVSEARHAVVVVEGLPALAKEGCRNAETDVSSRDAGELFVRQPQVGLRRIRRSPSRPAARGCRAFGEHVWP